MLPRAFVRTPTSLRDAYELAPWLWWAGSLACATAVVAGALIWQQRLDNASLSVAQAHAMLESEVARAQRVEPPKSADFVGTLPRHVDAHQAVRALQVAGNEAGVKIASVSLRESAARKDQLGRLEISVMAQGAYPALKQVLSEWLSRYPSATVKSQLWRRLEGQGGAAVTNAAIEASWVLSIWMAPLDANAGATSGVAPLPAASVAIESRPSAR